jgi:uncharacterized protein (TIGR03086 family)
MNSGLRVVYTGMDTVDLGPAAHRLTELLALVRDDDLRKPTPCPAYTLGDLIEHVGGLALAFAGAARKDSAKYGNKTPSGDASRLGADWRERIPRDLGTLAEAWRAPGAWTGMTRIAGMDAPAAMVGLTAADEVAVHGWDIARALGQPYDCEPAVLEGARNFLTQFSSPDAPAGPEVMFGPSRELPGDAPLLDRVVALAGRDPGWSPS